MRPLRVPSPLVPVLLAVVTLTACAPAVPAPGGPAAPPIPTPGETPVMTTTPPRGTARFIVKPTDAQPAGLEDRVRAAVDGPTTERGRHVVGVRPLATGGCVVELDSGLDANEAAAWLAAVQARSDVAYAEPDAPMRGAAQRG